MSDRDMESLCRSVKELGEFCDSSKSEEEILVMADRTDRWIRV